MIRFPKKQCVRKKRRHGKSILQEKDGRCYLCTKLYGDDQIHEVLHKHHIFGGSRRKISEAEGLYVWLCPDHHELGPEAVHREYGMMRLIQEDAQRAYEKTHTREEFMQLAGKNYL